MISLDSYISFASTLSGIAEIFQLSVTCRRDEEYYAPGRGGGWGGGSLDVRVFCVFFLLFFFIENIMGRLYNIQNSKLCFRDMKIMSLRNGGDFGKQLVLRTRCLPNHHHSFVT